MATVASGLVFSLSSANLRSSRSVEDWTARVCANHDLTARAGAVALILSAIRQECSLTLDWAADTEEVWPLQLAAHEGIVTLLYRAPERGGIHERDDVRMLTPLHINPLPEAPEDEESAASALIPIVLNKLPSAAMLTTGQRNDLAQSLRIIATELTDATFRRAEAGSVYATESAPIVF